MLREKIIPVYPPIQKDQMEFAKGELIPRAYQLVPYASGNLIGVWNILGLENPQLNELIRVVNDLEIRALTLWRHNSNWTKEL